MGIIHYPGRIVDKMLSCKKCANLITSMGRAMNPVQMIQRPKSRDKSAGHIKHFYCVICRDSVEHEELPTHS